MPTPQPTSNLTISLSKEQLGFLAYLYPNEDPEDALIKLLDRARSRAIRRAEQQVRVLNLDQEKAEDQEENPEEPVNLSGDVVENPIGELQELCQKQQISMPRYEFSEIPDGFACAVQAMGLQGHGEGPSKKDAKTEAAGRLLELVNPN
ncbi:double-stranded RNA binding motif domain-containing protein [Acaryochloris marina NIES-2412]|uniref:double-stranded RNA binding motif domain-containing protein n=1 Tax=Acaryochloris marina TaxID=155978 RepID=UPI004059046C